jgi:parallel beta-helix repeat protein
VVVDNHLEDQGNGIVLDYGCYNNSISDNTINGTGYNALFLGDCAGNKVSNNIIINVAHVLDSYEASENRIFMNTVLSYGSMGFRFPRDFHGKIFYRNEGASISVAGDNNTIYENICEIHFRGANNLVFHNDASRISLRGASNSEVYENSVAEVIIDGGSNNIIRDNNINGTGTGVGVEGSSNNTIQNNNITTIGSAGVAIYQGGWNKNFR